MTAAGEDAKRWSAEIELCVHTAQGELSADIARMLHAVSERLSGQLKASAAAAWEAVAALQAENEALRRRLASAEGRAQDPGCHPSDAGAELIGDNATSWSASEADEALVLAAPDLAPLACTLPVDDAEAMQAKGMDLGDNEAPQRAVDDPDLRDLSLETGGASKPEGSSPGGDESQATRKSQRVSVRDADLTRPQRFVRHWVFENAFVMLIILNCVLMGLQAHLDITRYGEKGHTQPFKYAEWLCTLLFLVEVFLRYVAFGWRTFSPFELPDGPLNCFDAVIVAITTFATFVVPFLSGTTTLRVVSMLRALRLFRLIRVLRTARRLKDVWMMLRGILDSIGILFWTVVVIASITYIFAVFGVVLIGMEVKKAMEADPQAEYLQRLKPYINGVDLMMMTLIQVLTLDSWNGVVRELIEVVGWCWIYFYIYISFAVFVLLNLVTAIIVDTAMAKSRSDEYLLLREKQAEHDREMKDLAAIFELMDTSGDGMLSWDEFMDCFEDPNIADKWMLLGYSKAECKELFAILDEGDGEVSWAEFHGGLARMKGEALSKDVFKVQRMLEKQAAATPRIASSGGRERTREVSGGRERTREVCPKAPEAEALQGAAPASGLHKLQGAAPASGLHRLCDRQDSLGSLVL